MTAPDPRANPPSTSPGTPDPATPERFGARRRALEADEARARGVSRSRVAAVAVVAAVLASAAAVPFALRALERSRQADAPTASPVAPTDRAWSADVERIVPSDDGLRVVAPGSRSDTPLAVRGHVPSGATIRTDERTEARLRMTDGSAVVIERGSEIELLADRPRGIRLVRGAMRADVVHLPMGPRAEILGSHGRVEVVGTRFRVTEATDRTVVAVQRGLVRFGSAGHPVEVGEGQEAAIERGGAVRLYASERTSTRSWLDEEETGEDDADTDEPLPGLGELRARRPGEREEQERPLALADHRVRVNIVGTVARTEIEETFRNDDDVTLEGIYRFPLPDGARIASLELEVEGQFERGAFVERERARRIFRGVVRHATPTRERVVREEIVWVPGPWRDPALLEQQRGGRFELRIFPIPARGERRVRIAYEEDVRVDAGRRRYVHPLPSVRRGQARVGHFAFEVAVEGHDASAGIRAGGYDLRVAGASDAPRLAFEQNDFAPNGDLAVEYALAGGEAALRYAQYRGDAIVARDEPRRPTNEVDDVATAEAALETDERGYALFTIRPDLPDEAAHRPTDYAIVVDSSQSMHGARLARAVGIAEELVAALDRRHRAVVLACDVRCLVAPEGLVVPSPEAATRARTFLEGVSAAGGTNLVATFEHAARALGAEHDRDRAVVYVGDGTVSVGAVGTEFVSAEIAAIASGSGLAIHTVAVGSDADASMLDSVARAGGGHFLPSRAGESRAATAEAVIAATSGPSLVAPTVTFPRGVESVAPSVLPTLRDGAEVRVAARLEGAIDGELVLRGKISGRPFEQRYPVRLGTTDAGRNTFVPRAWASERIADLERTGGSEPETIALSQRFGVVSRATSLLVLESEAMFRAYGLDRSNGPLEWTGREGIDETTFGEVASNDDEADLLDTEGAPGGPLLGRSAGAGGASSEAMAAAPASAAAPARAAAADPLDGVRPWPMPPREPPRRGSYMRRVPYREASIRAAEAVSQRDLDALASAEAALAAEPDHRDRVRDVVRAALRAGRTETVEKTLAAWIARDPADVDALALAADVAHRAGRADEALRLLSGIVEPDARDVLAQRRVADAYERAGDTRTACAHRVAIATTSSSDGDALRAGLECARTLRLDATARLLEARTAGFAGRIESTPARPLDAVRGELVLDARFAGGDVDLVVVTPRGERVSFLGGRTGVTARDVRSTSSESLGLRGARIGGHRIEVVRADASRQPIRGVVRIRALGETRELPFELVGTSATVGRVDVVQRFRLVPL